MTRFELFHLFDDCFFICIAMTGTGHGKLTIVGDNICNSEKKLSVS
jgi:hypothetical protein